MSGNNGTHHRRKPSLLETKAADRAARSGSGSATAGAEAPASNPWEAKPAARPPASGITAADLVARDFPPPRFVLDGLLAEGLTILGGRPKQGKSWLSLLIAWAVAGGYELDGRPTREGEVLYLALEDTPRRLKKRLLMLNGSAAWDVPCGLHLHTDWPRAPDGGLYFVADWLAARRKTARLVIVDTLAKFRRPQKGGANGYAEDYEAVGDLQKLCGEFGASGLVVHHTRKLRAEDPFDELSGTLGISGAADSLWVLDRDRGKPTGELFVTGRDLPDGTVPLSFNAADCRWKLGDTREGIDTAGRAASEATNKVGQCAQWLKEFLRDYAHPSDEIKAAAAAAGFSFSALRDAKVSLGKQGTNEVVNHNFGGGGVNDWWSGLGPVSGWKRRPAPGRKRADSPESQESQESQGDDSEEVPN